MSDALPDFSFDDHDAILFDLDGVITDTASIHADAWKRMFDEYLQRWSAEHGHAFVPFQVDPDYLAYVDGKPRVEGVTSFLESRRIILPTGSPGDPTDVDTIHGLSNRKNELVLAMIAEEGVEVFDGSVRFAEAARAAGLATAVVSSSRNATHVLETVGLSHLFDDIVDGVVAADLGLPGKPEPDTFVEAARRLDVTPARAVVVEDAIVGVEAGRVGGFGCVIGVDRHGEADRLLKHGATIVVADLAELLER